MWQCDCGQIKIINAYDVKTGKITSCGCSRRKQLIERNKKNIDNLLGKKFGKLTVIQQEPSQRGRTVWLCECECGNTKIVNSAELKNGDTLSCGCLKSSYGEQIIENILKENNILYKKEFSFNNLLSENNVPLRFDFAIFNKQNQLLYLIEYDGEQHFNSKGDNQIWSDSFEKRKRRDEIKTIYCLNNNIPLIRIPYWKKNNITILDLII